MKELAKRKSELVIIKTNYVHDMIIKKKDLDQQTSKASFSKVFKPITDKLDDVIVSNLKIPTSNKHHPKKGEVPDYGIDTEDEVEGMN